MCVCVSGMRGILGLVPMGVAKYIYIWSVRTELSLSPVSLIIHTKSSQHRHTHTHTHWPACLPACLPSTHMNTGMLAMHKSYKNLNTRWFTNLFFILLSLPATHTHTHTHTPTHFGPPGRTVMPRLPLLWERKDGELSSGIHLIF